MPLFPVLSYLSKPFVPSTGRKARKKVFTSNQFHISIFEHHINTLPSRQCRSLLFFFLFEWHFQLSFNLNPLFSHFLWNNYHELLFHKAYAKESVVADKKIVQRTHLILNKFNSNSSDQQSSLLCSEKGVEKTPQ